MSFEKYSAAVDRYITAVNHRRNLVKLAMQAEDLANKLGYPDQDGYLSPKNFSLGTKARRRAARRWQKVFE